SGDQRKKTSPEQSGGRRKGQVEGDQTNNLSERISKLDPEPVACQDESTSDFLSDFADERRWGESQRRSVAWIRLADSAILELAIRWSSAFSRLTDRPSAFYR